MTPARHNRIAEVFSAAAELPIPERAAFLDGACAGDPPLREEVESLLTHDGAPPSALDAPILGTGLTQGTEADPALEVNLPEKIGPYRVLGLLGVGSMGVVYRAQQEAPSRAVAVKVMHPGCVSRSLRRRFLDEMESLSRLQHPGIAQIYDAGEESTDAGPRPYIVMQLVEGQPLDVFRAALPRDPQTRIALLAKLCDAVQYAHQQGIIHRDLKPANIIVDHGDDGPAPRILDFGLARIIDHDVCDGRAATLYGQLLGTLAYMSPEQASADPHAIDTRSDVYSLGVIGYELLCGHLPVDVRELAVPEALHAIRSQAPLPLCDHSRSFRGDLTIIFAKALAKDKNQRYESAAALAADLRNFARRQPIAARPPSATYVLAKLAQRHRLVLIVALLGVGTALWALGRAYVAERRLRAQYIETRDVAGFLVRDFTHQLNEIGGTNEARGGLLQRLRAHIERLLAQEPQDLKLLIAHADVLKGLSDVELDANHKDFALELREQALAIRRQVAAEAPNDLDRQADLSIALVQKGDVFHDRKDFKSALPLYERALAIDEALVQRKPDSHGLRSNLLWSYMRLAQLARELGDMDRLACCVDGATEQLTAILAQHPEDAHALHARVCLEQMRAESATDPGQDTATDKRIEEALKCARRLIAQAPANPVYQRDCAGLLILAGTRATLREDFVAADSLLREAAAVLQRVLQRNPSDLEAQHYLVWAYRQWGRVALASGDLADAATLMDRACAIAEPLVVKHPDDAMYARRLMQVDLQRAHIAFLQNDMTTARVHWQRGAGLCLRLAADPRTQLRDLVTYAQGLVALPAPELQDVDSAMAIARRALDNTADEMPQAWILLATCHQLRGCSSEARECYEQALAHSPADAVELRQRVREYLQNLPAESSAP